MMISLIDNLQKKIGTLTVIAIAIMTLVTFFTALLRKFDIGSNGFIELQWYLYSFVFLCAGANVLRTDQHIRVNVLSQRFSPRTRALVDIVGHVLFLLPLCGMIVYISSVDAFHVWQSGEKSPDAGGLIRWPVKIWIPIAFALLMLQMLVEILRLLPALKGGENGV